MTEGFETEIKLGLPDEAAWRWVRERISPVRVVHQTNHYFDRPGRLSPAPASAFVCARPQAGSA